MSNRMRRTLSILLVICLSLALVPVALMEEMDNLQTEQVEQTIEDGIGNLEEASTEAMMEDEVVEVFGTDSEIPEIEEEIAFGEPEQNSPEEAGVIEPVVEEQAEPFNQEATIDDVVIGVSGTANAFPQGATLRVEKVVDETVVEAVEALLSAQEVCAHFQYRIEVLDASGNAIVPNEGDELPVICVKGIDVAEETKAAYYDAVSEAACLIEAETGEGEMRFAFVASAIYDIVTVKAEEDQQEQPSEEEQPSKDEQTQENAVKTGEDAEGSEKTEDSGEEKADSEGEEKEAEDQDAAGEVWQTAEVIPTDDVIEMDDAEMDEAAKLMEADSALAAAATYQYLPSILTVGDVYDLNQCLLIDGYNPSDIVSWKSSRSGVVKIARDGTLTALKKGSAKITVKTNDRKKRTIRVSVKKNAINGIYSKPSKSEAVALGEAFSIMPKSLKHTGKRIEAEFYLLNGSNKRIRYLRDLDLEIYLGSRKNKLVGGNFSKIKVSSKKKGVSTFKVAFQASSALMKNVHFADYPANQVYYTFSTKYFYSTAGRSGVPFEQTVIPNLPDIVYVTAITLNSGSLSLTKGKTAQLTATVNPDNAENNAINWSSSNPAVATVDGNGKVTAVAGGDATITATAADGSGVKASCKVTVSSTSSSTTKSNPTSISLNMTKIQVVEGLTDPYEYKLIATISPSSANNSVTWSSSNSSVATVDSSGNVKIKGKGNAVITAKTVNSLTATCNITVILPGSESVPNPPQDVYAKAQSTSSIKVSWSKPSGGNVTGYKLYYGTSSSSSSASLYGTYGSSTTSVTVTGLRSDKTYYFWVKATNSAGDSAFSSKDYDTTFEEFNINVSHRDHPNIIKNGVVKEKTIDVYNGAATMTWDVDCTTTWSVRKSGAMIASVSKTNSSQLVINIADGISSGSRTATVTITANSNDYTITLKQTATAPDPTGIDLNMNNKQVYLGIDAYKYTLVATVSPSNANSNITWSSNNTSVATVTNDGKVTITAGGTVTITAKTVNGLKATCTFTVIDPR